jgi:hypothetical protein
MKYLVIFALTLPTLSFAKMSNLKPGKWLMTMTMMKDGKEHDPLAEMRAAVAKMPPEQRKEVEASLRGQLGNVTDKGTEICYSQKSFEQVAMAKPAENCESKIIEDSATKFRSTFSCKDGSKGDSNFNISGDNQIAGTINVTTASGDKTSVKNNMKFVSQDCGGLKPVEIK